MVRSVDNHDAINGYLGLGEEWEQSGGQVDSFVHSVSTAHSIHGAARALRRHRLAAEEAIFAGTSTGANVVGALREAERLGPSATVVTIVVDSGLRYLSTDLYGS